MSTGNSVSVKFEMDSTAGGSLAEYTTQIDKIGDFEVKHGMITNTPFGTAAITKAFTGMIECGAVPIEGEITDGASDIFAVLNAARGGVSRTVKITYLTGDYINGEMLVENVKITPGVGAITRFQSTLHPTGSFSVFV